MSQIAILIEQMFEDSAFRVPYDKPDDLRAFSEAILHEHELADGVPTQQYTAAERPDHRPSPR